MELFEKLLILLRKKKKVNPHLYLVDAIRHCAENALEAPTNEEFKTLALHNMISLLNDLAEEMEEM
jgi:hypothetical protein